MAQFQPPPYLTYFSLTDNVVITVFHSIAIPLMTHLIYCQYFNKTRLKVLNLAPSMIIFPFTHVICATLEMPYHVYLVWKWNPTRAYSAENMVNSFKFTDGLALEAVGAYDPYVLYWTGLWNQVYFQLISLSVLFLSLDRLLAVNFPYNYNYQIEKWMPGITITIILGYLFVPIILYLMALPLELDKVQYYQSYSCVVTRYPTVITNIARQVILATNLVVSGYLLCILRSYGNKKEKLNNRAVQITIVFDILLNFIPSAVWYTASIVFKFNIGNHVGSMLSVLMTFNIAIVAVYTWFILTRRTGPKTTPGNSRTQISGIKFIA